MTTMAPPLAISNFTSNAPSSVVNPALGGLSGPPDLDFLLLRTDLDTQFTLNAAYLVFFMQVRVDP